MAVAKPTHERLHGIFVDENDAVAVQCSPVNSQGRIGEQMAAVELASAEISGLAGPANVGSDGSPSHARQRLGWMPIVYMVHAKLQTLGQACGDH